MNNNSVNVPRLDREIDRVFRQLDSVVDECIGNLNPINEVSQEYLTDLQDGEQDKSTEHYQALNANQFTLESTDEMTKGDLTDQMQRQEAELTDSAQYNISAENEDVVDDDVQSPVTIDESDSSRDVMKMDFYVKRGNKQVGPVTGEKIINHYQNGKVVPTDEVSQDTIGPWVAFSDSVFSPWI